MGHCQSNPKREIHGITSPSQKKREEWKRKEKERKEKRKEREKSN